MANFLADFLILSFAVVKYNLSYFNIFKDFNKRQEGGGVEEQKYGQLTCSKLRGKYEYKGTKKGGGGGIPIFPPIGK